MKLNFSYNNYSFKSHYPAIRSITYVRDDCVQIRYTIVRVLYISIFMPDGPVQILLPLRHHPLNYALSWYFASHLPLDLIKLSRISVQLLFVLASYECTPVFRMPTATTQLSFSDVKVYDSLQERSSYQSKVMRSFSTIERVKCDTVIQFILIVLLWCGV